MKKNAFWTFPLAGAVLGCALLAGCGPAKASYAVPEYPWTLTLEEACRQQEEAGTAYTLGEDGGGTDTHLSIEEGEVLELAAQNITLQFDAASQLTGISWDAAGEQRDAVEKALCSIAGDPVESYAPAVFGPFLLGGGRWTNEAGEPLFSVYLDTSYRLADGEFLVWHSSAPLAETWSEDEQALWIQGYKDIWQPQGLSFADAPADSWQRNGEETTVWHGQEAWDAWFENNWEYLASMTCAEDGCRMEITRLLPDHLSTQTGN